MRQRFNSRYFSWPSIEFWSLIHLKKGNYFSVRFNFLPFKKKKKSTPGFHFPFLIISMQNGNQTEILKSGPKLLYFFPNRNQFIYSFPVFPACKRMINLGKMTLKEKKKRIKTKIKPLKNPRSECYQKVNVKMFP